MRRIASMAEMHGVSLAPHHPLGPIAVAACLQLDFTCPNEAAVEWAAICAHGGGIRCGGMPMAGSPNGRTEADVTPR